MLRFSTLCGPNEQKFGELLTWHKVIILSTILPNLSTESWETQHLKVKKQKPKFEFRTLWIRDDQRLRFALRICLADSGKRLLRLLDARRVSCSVAVLHGLPDVNRVHYDAGDVAQQRRIPEHLRQQPHFAARNDVSSIAAFPTFLSTQAQCHTFCIEKPSQFQAQALH